ncbi:histidine kinase dimerization/phospho-acceptor domain-containing protein, partial [Acinetobacter baumannii]
VAHELRTPLADLAFTLDELADAGDDEARNAAHQEAVAALKRTTSLFDAMLRLAEIEAGTARERFAMFDLTALAADMAEAYRPEIEASGRKLELSLARNCGAVGDADLVTQAL